MVREIVVAAALKYSIDTDGSLWLRIYDFRGYPLCVIPVDRSSALVLADFIMGHLYDDEDDDDEDDIGEPLGRA